MGCHTSVPFGQTKLRCFATLPGTCGLICAVVWACLGAQPALAWPGKPGKPAQSRGLVPPPGVAFDADITYCKHPDCRLDLKVLPLCGACAVACRCDVQDCNLKLNVAYPKEGKGPFPAVILIHGGGWFYGNSYDCVPFSLRLAAKGYVAVTISYRLLPKNRFPDQIHDVKCAVRWLRANATKYRLDTDRIGVFGHSAGGHLACLLGLAHGHDALEGNGGYHEHRSDVCCVVCTSGLTDLSNLCIRPAPGLAGAGTRMAVQAFLGGPPAKVGKRYDLASPITYASKNAPPTLLICGTKDILVPNEQSLRLEKKLREAGALVRLLTLVGAEHDFFGVHRERAEEAILAFFERHLKNRTEKR